MTQHATPQEIMDAFANLSDRERRVIHAIARKHLGGTRFSEPLDLVHEALFLSVEGRRKWPLDIDFAIFLSMTIRSVAYADRTVSENAMAARVPVEDVLEWSIAPHASHPSAESCAQQAQEFRLAWSTVASARGRLAERDPLAARVLDGFMNEAPAAELRRELGICAAELDAARKRVLRALRNTARL